MKKILKTLCFLVFLFLPISLVSAQESERILEFNSNIELRESTDIHITEEIYYYFPTQRHGIIREIPTNYKVSLALKRPTTLSIDNVYYYPAGVDNPQRYSTYERSLNSGYTTIKIGDPDTYVSGTFVYFIEYTLKNAVNYFDTHDELYLNITGNGWEVPIDKVTATIKVPGEITEKICYTGPLGSEASDCQFESVSDTEVIGTTETPLGIYGGYTVALKMPKGTLVDTTGQQRLAFLLSNLGLLLPIPIFLFVFNIVKNKGRNKKITIIPHYSPEKDSYPLLAGYILKKKLDYKHITAEIIQLAIDGHLKIRKEKKKEYVLERLTDGSEIKNTAQLELFNALFAKSLIASEIKKYTQTIKDAAGNTTKTIKEEIKGVNPSDFKDEINTKKISNSFYLTVNKMQGQIYGQVYEEDIFSDSHKKLRAKLLGFGFGGIFLSFLLIAPLTIIAAGGWLIGLMVSSVLVIILGFRVDLLSEKGNSTYYSLQGLRMYIDTAEKHRIEFHNDPEKYIKVFEKLLPYAIIFGLEKKWAKEFEDIYTEPPSWYAGDISTFNAYVLANSLGSISNNVKSKSMATNSSGGFSSSHGGSGGSGFSGGSSGGGFGGGGGGSW